jgi:hypothetical protein
VVYLPAGAYRTSKTLVMKSGVVLRGAGRTQTKILHARTDSSWGRGAIWMGTEPDRNYSTGVVNVVGDLVKGSTTVTVQNGSAFRAGDFIHIDQIDDESYNNHTLYGGVWADPIGSRTGGSPWRTLRTLGEVTAVSGNDLTLKDPVHHTFPAAFSPQVVRRPRSAFTTWAGVEDLYVTGGTGRGGLIGMGQCAYCWVKGVEANGRYVLNDRMNAGGTFGISAAFSYRVVIRDSYVHDADYYAQSTDSYGIVIWDATTNSLVENSISVWRNKPIQFQFSGGGNVVGYCYADNALNMDAPYWAEMAIDMHCQYPHHELLEGNYASMMGPDSTHGGSGWVTFFRNHASGLSVGGTTVGAAAPGTFPNQTGNLAGITVNEMSRYPTMIGNVLLQPGVMRTSGGTVVTKGYMITPYREDGQVNAYDLGFINDPIVEQTTQIHLDYDYARNMLSNNAANPVKTLPDSLYLTIKPSFFGANTWPWVNPQGTTDAERVKTLPAKARFEAGVP